jgi:nucleoside-diphosphate-sugar epimerase
MIAVLGATGGIGGAVVRELAAQGRPVRAVSRSGRRPWGTEGSDVDTVAADLATPEGARAAVAGAEVVIHAAQPDYRRWPQEFPAMTAGIADACEQVGARLVLADNLYMYGPVTGAITESSPARPTSTKGRVRLAMADDLLARHRAGRLSVVLGRASDYYGPGGLDSTPGVLVFSALAKGKSARWMGRLDQPHTLHYLPDVGRALVALADAPEDAYGRAWILPAAAPRTGAEWIDLATAAAGRPRRPKVIAPWQNRLGGLFVPMVRELNEIMDQFTQPFVVDDAAYRTAFGDRPTEAEEGVRATVAWFRDRVQA